MITRKELRKLFYYEPSTGWLIRRVLMGKTGKPGTIPAIKHNYGYLSICINGKKYLTHRLVFLYHIGKLPETIDHINGVKTDNRIENLRAATYLENNFNRGKKSNNKSGFKGVKKQGNKWVAKIGINGETRHLGVFDTPEKASEAYNEAAKELHGDFYYHENKGDHHAR